jgi:hypothetical protein
VVAQHVVHQASKIIQALPILAAESCFSLDDLLNVSSAKLRLFISALLTLLIKDSISWLVGRCRILATAKISS